MTYDSWNDLIYKYYFRSTSESKVIFHITLQDLVEFAKEENVEIAKDRFAAEFSDEFIRTDFVSKFWIDIKTGNRNIDDLQNKTPVYQKLKKFSSFVPYLFWDLDYLIDLINSSKVYPLNFVISNLTGCATSDVFVYVFVFSVCAAPQEGQNFVPSSSLLPQLGQNAIFIIPFSCFPYNTNI